MRRTYRSKKDTGGALDHRDVLQNVDERSSAFDAFYIENIKQTKRELSCVASSNVFEVASHKVRKRKYVKRLVKELEPIYQRETISPTAYLTPDKSIRVNKILDPFDMLLNSSPASRETPKAAKDDIPEKFLPKNIRTCKTYTRRKLPKTKKVNCSSSDSYCIDSDKENTSQSCSNVTDIRTHELIIEKEPKKSPKIKDDSINKIVNNLSLINKVKCKGSNGSFNTSYKLNRSKLYKNLQSPIQKSPFCSTPFMEKYRGVSIYKFSPISIKVQGISPNRVTLSTEKSGCKTQVLHRNKHPDTSQECTQSPLTHVPNIRNKCMSKLLINEKEDSSNVSSLSNVSQCEMVHIIDDELKNDDISQRDVIIDDVMKINNISQNEIIHIDVWKKDRYSITDIEHSSLHTTETEPFVGFINNDNDDEENIDKISIINVIQEYDLLEEKKYDLKVKETEMNTSQTDDLETHSISAASNRCNTSLSSIELKDSMSESMYDTCNSEESSLEDNCENNREPVVVIERLNNTIFTKYYEKMLIDSQDLDLDEQTDIDEFESLANDSQAETTKDSFNPDSDLDDIKTSEVVVVDSSTTDDVVSSNDEAGDKNENECVSFVTTRRRNEINVDSMFLFENSYASGSTDCEKTVLSNKVYLEKSNSNISISSDSNIDYVDNKEEEIVNKDFEVINTPSEQIISRISDESNKIQSSDIIHRKHNTKHIGRKSKERISRMTHRKSTRPRQSQSNSPELNTSSSNTTVIDNNKSNTKTVIESDGVSNENKCLKLRLSAEKSSELKRNIKKDDPESSIISCAGAEIKPSIVLQPGKKWERSLSIYRRMTMAADHFNHSILEEECTQRKGRKYRQSVISTMEMQECRDSLHNDSINSRRSTFVSKPGRPTIRFVIDPNISRVSLSTSSLFDDLKGFLTEECDDTVIELSKLSIADSEHEVTILDNFHETERVATARDYVLRRCNQTEPIPFDECYPETVLKNCHKIGEGVYGEVFLWRGRDGRARVMKIVPIAGAIKVNGEDQKDFHEIISEIVIAMELSALRAPTADIDRQLDEGHDIHALDLHTIANATDTFNEVLAVRCVFGPYPSRLLDLWELYDECKGSENDNPAALPPDQQYIVLELANAGQDLESYQFANAQQAHALFQQIAFGLAVAEEAFQFEHRDLHWGNVLIAPTEQKLASFVLRGRVYRVPRHGVHAAVIDYSLSRLSLPLHADSAALYNDLATDDQLFDAAGDYQFEVYRLMRDKLGNDWKNFEPYTNILWLHYTVDKMITALRYKRTNTKIHKHYIDKLKGIKNRILEYGSAVQYVLTDIDI